MLINDVRYAIRQLRRAPSFTLTAVMTLALGIGASSAIFCLMDAYSLHPMRVPHVGELVRLFAPSTRNSRSESRPSRAWSLSAGAGVSCRERTAPRLCC